MCIRDSINAEYMGDSENFLLAPSVFPSKGLQLPPQLVVKGSNYDLIKLSFEVLTYVSYALFGILALEIIFLSRVKLSCFTFELAQMIALCRYSKIYYPPQIEAFLSALSVFLLEINNEVRFDDEKSQISYGIRFELAKPHPLEAQTLPSKLKYLQRNPFLLDHSLIPIALFTGMTVLYFIMVRLGQKALAESDTYYEDTTVYKVKQRVVNIFYIVCQLVYLPLCLGLFLQLRHTLIVESLWSIINIVVSVFCIALVIGIPAYMIYKWEFGLRGLFDINSVKVSYSQLFYNTNLRLFLGRHMIVAKMTLKIVATIIVLIIRPLILTQGLILFALVMIMAFLVCAQSPFEDLFSMVVTVFSCFVLGFLFFYGTIFFILDFTQESIEDKNRLLLGWIFIVIALGLLLLNLIFTAVEAFLTRNGGAQDSEILDETPEPKPSEGVEMSKSASAQVAINPKN
eukprot:TRINITY_DN24671_c0_g1_i2.p1 TRINITY_DN24671_c0_g1~~TRINITY_DN24671_c0_g1_i2.p1  ORF type:complete len:457 (-),score=50.94 TRINITY_DN24671_c0_g1_i2:13-1383(-)